MSLQQLAVAVWLSAKGKAGTRRKKRTAQGITTPKSQSDTYIAWGLKSQPDVTRVAHILLGALAQDPLLVLEDGLLLLVSTLNLNVGHGQKRTSDRVEQTPKDTIRSMRHTIGTNAET